MVLSAERIESTRCWVDVNSCAIKEEAQTGVHDACDKPERASWLRQDGRRMLSRQMARIRADEIASELGISADAVHVAKSRVLRGLREELADLLD